MAPWKGFVAAALLAVFVQPDGLPAAEPDAGRKAEIAALIAELGNESFARREAATERLVLAGPVAAESLLVAAQDQNTEVAWRATSALEQVSPKLEDKDVQRLLARLNKVNTAQHPHLATVVADLQARARQLQHAAALEKIRALGGETQQPTATDAASLPDPAAAAEPKPISPDEAAPINAGPEALKLVAIPAIGAAEQAIEAPRFLPDVPPAIFEPSVPEVPAEPVTEEPAEFDTAAEPAPPPDFLPVAPLGVAPAIEGEVSDAYVGTVEIGGQGPVDPQNLAANPVPSLWLTAKWRGGDDGLALLQDLPELGELTLDEADVTDAGLKHIAVLPSLSYLKVHGTGITSAGLRKLRSQKPGLTILAFGRTILGVNAEVEGDRCRVASVNPNSGAAASGIQVGDFITHINDQKVVSFVDLMIATFDRQPGDKLQLQYERGGETKTAVVELKPRVERPTVLR